MKLQNGLRPFNEFHTCRMAVKLPGVEKILIFIEKQVGTRYGHWILVRIMLYRIPENRIDGVVITFSIIISVKTLQTQLRQDWAVTKRRVKEGMP